MPGSESREKLGVKDAWNYFQERFGIGRDDIKHRKIVKKSGDFWLTSDQEEPDLEYKTVGIRLLRDTGSYLKPTTYGLQILEDEISRNKVEISREEFLTLLEGDMIERKMSEKGYVALVFKGRVLGCGLYKDELVSSRIPKGRGEELENFI